MVSFQQWTKTSGSETLTYSCVCVLPVSVSEVPWERGAVLCIECEMSPQAHIQNVCFLAGVTILGSCGTFGRWVPWVTGGWDLRVLALPTSHLLFGSTAVTAPSVMPSLP